MLNFLSPRRIIAILFLLLGLSCSKSENSITYGLTTSINGGEGGQVSPASGTFELGESVTIIATPDEGFVFESWGGSASGTSNPLQITINSATRVSASFVKIDSDGDGVFDDVDECPNTAEGVSVDSSGCEETQNDGGGAVEEEDADDDGVADGDDLCADTPEGETVDANGCSESQRDTDGDGVSDDLDTCSETPADTEVDENGCEIMARTFVPNDEFEQYLIDLGLDDTLDDFVLTANIESVTELEFGEQLAIDDIADDLTGIEAFSGLISLTLNSQTVNELNIIAHPTLENIFLKQCSIQNMEVSGNSNLIELSLTQGASVQNLLFSENPLAETISIFESGWINAIISSNPRLTSIANDDNHFGTTTRITNNQSLAEINWVNGSFGDTTFANNPNLTSVTIFFCNTRTLDISQNPSITSLSLGETSFESLDLSNNNLTNFSISHDPPSRVDHELLTCIKVNQEQLDNIPATWEKEDSMNYAIDCQ